MPEQQETAPQAVNLTAPVVHIQEAQARLADIVRRVDEAKAGKQYPTPADLARMPHELGIVRAQAELASSIADVQTAQAMAQYAQAYSYANLTAVQRGEQTVLAARQSAVKAEQARLAAAAQAAENEKTASPRFRKVYTPQG